MSIHNAVPNKEPSQTTERTSLEYISQSILSLVLNSAINVSEAAHLALTDSLISHVMNTYYRKLFEESKDRQVYSVYGYPGYHRYPYNVNFMPFSLFTQIC